MKTQILMAAIVTGFGLTALQATAQTDEQVPEVQAAPAEVAPDSRFTALDTDGDGAVSREEFDARGGDRFAALDTDGDGALSAEEMVAEARTRAQEMIARFDENGDGLLQEAEMPTPAEARSARMFDSLDADGDGTVTAEEFADAPQRGMRGERGGRHGGGEQRRGVFGGGRG